MADSGGSGATRLQDYNLEDCMHSRDGMSFRLAIAESCISVPELSRPQQQAKVAGHSYTFGYYRQVIYGRPKCLQRPTYFSRGYTGKRS